MEHLCCNRQRYCREPATTKFVFNSAAVDVSRVSHTVKSEHRLEHVLLPTLDVALNYPYYLPPTQRTPSSVGIDRAALDELSARHEELTSQRVSSCETSNEQRFNPQLFFSRPVWFEVLLKTTP